MTEYTGWEDYVDRIRRNKQYKQIKEEWKGAVDEYFGVEKTNDNSFRLIKDLNMAFDTLSQRVSNLNERINKITDCGHGKLKQMVTPLHQANVIGRIEALEDFRRNHSGEFHVGKDLGHVYAAKAIDELQKKVRELEDNQHKHGHTEILLRVEKLEEWKSDYKSDDEVIKNLFKKYSDRIEDLEEWRNNPPTRLSELEQQMSKLTSLNHTDKEVLFSYADYGRRITDLEKRQLLLIRDVESLERWKQNRETPERLPNPSGDMCVTKKIKIDKQVWEDIKLDVAGLVKNPTQGYIREQYMSLLVSRIKKVDPEWEPDKK